MLSKIVPLADYSVLRQCHMCVETLVYLLPPIKQTAVAHRQSIRINWICRWCNSWWRTAWLIWFQLHLASDNFEAVRDYDGVSLEGSRAENSSDKSNMLCCRERSFDSCCVNWSTGVLSKRATCSDICGADLLVSRTMELGARAGDIRGRIKQGSILPMSCPRHETTNWDLSHSTL